MDYLIICLVALAASGLTLFSGFGLGTLLMPAFALFFPVPTAIASTAVVHLANNLFKLALLGKAADWRVVLRFGLPAALAAILGAASLVGIAGLAPVIEYDLAGRHFQVTPVKLVIGVLIVIFAVLELTPRFGELAIPGRYLPLGGVISGFFGGLSGNQGAFRSAFLIKAGLEKKAFVATGVVSAVLVDTTRIAVYGGAFLTTQTEALPSGIGGLVVAAIVAAFAGAFAGARLLEKVTMKFVRYVVALGMIGIGVALAAGWV